MEHLTNDGGLFQNRVFNYSYGSGRYVRERIIKGIGNLGNVDVFTTVTAYTGTDTDQITDQDSFARCKVQTDQSNRVSTATKQSK